MRLKLIGYSKVVRRLSLSIFLVFGVASPAGAVFANLIRAILLPIVCFAMAAPIAARGELISIDYVGRVSKITFRDVTSGTTLADHGLGGVDVGSLVTGSFAYDLIVNVDSNASPSIGAYHPALVSMTFHAGSFLKTLTPTLPNRILNFVNDSNAHAPILVDGIEAFAFSELGDSIFVGGRTQIGDVWLSEDPSTLTSDAMQVLPSGVNWMHPSGGPIGFRDSNAATTDILEILASLESYTVTVSSVPVPATYALMLAGLGLLGWVGRRKRLAAA